MEFALADLAAAVGAELRGDPTCRVRAVAPLASAGPGEIAFLANPRYRGLLSSTAAAAVIMTAADAAAFPGNALLLDNPYLGYARVAVLLYPEVPAASGVHPSAVVAPDVRLHPSARVGPYCVLESRVSLAEGVQLGPGCFVGRDSRIGRDSRLAAHVTIYHATEIGQRVLIHSGAVVGSDGFGFAQDRGTWVKIPQLGRVRIGDDVEVGANTSIDRGALEDTVIEAGVKLDNQIQVAHNVFIGAHTAIAGCAGIAGSARIGRHCTIAGGVGIVGHLEIADHVHVTGMSMVTKSITEPGVYSSGTPLEPNREWHRNYVRFKQLDDMARRIKALERQLARLTSAEGEAVE